MIINALNSLLLTVADISILQLHIFTHSILHKTTNTTVKILFFLLSLKIPDYFAAVCPSSISQQIPKHIFLTTYLITVAFYASYQLHFQAAAAVLALVDEENNSPHASV